MHSPIPRCLRSLLAVLSIVLSAQFADAQQIIGPITLTCTASNVPGMPLTQYPDSYAYDGSISVFDPDAFCLGSTGACFVSGQMFGEGLSFVWVDPVFRRIMWEWTSPQGVVIWAIFTW